MTDHPADAVVVDGPTWFTADHHFGHANIIRFCDRPFADVDAMDAALVERWNDTVAPDDTVWVLGDVVMGNVDRTLKLAAQLHGRRHLVVGNHDRCFPGRSKPERWHRLYREAGFLTIQSRVDLDLGGTTVQANHFPFQADEYDGSRYDEHRPIDDGRWLLHGHVHDAWRVSGRQVNVGVDVWDYTPVSAATILDLVTAGR